MNEEDLVQPIAVLKNSGSHEEIVRYVAIASVQAYLSTQDDPSWSEWLSGRFTKSVRRGSASQLEALYELSPASIDTGSTVILAFKPMKYKDFPPELKKMRVLGLDRPKCGNWSNTYDIPPRAYIRENLDMSTGKLAAQMAHGLFAWALNRSNNAVNDWMKDNCRFRIEEVDDEFFEFKIGRPNTIVIKDAGFTEIEPDTITVVMD